QAGADCVLSVPGPVPQVPANGGMGTLSVNGAGPHCTSYVAQSSSSGLTIQSGQTGSTFPATVTFSVAPNTETFAITHTVMIAPPGVQIPSPIALFVQVGQNGPPVKTNAG